MIGDDVEVKIVGIRGRTVRLGIQAPGQVSVHRREVYVRMGRNPQTGKVSDNARSSM